MIEIGIKWSNIYKLNTNKCIYSKQNYPKINKNSHNYSIAQHHNNNKSNIFTL